MKKSEEHTKSKPKKTTKAVNSAASVEVMKAKSDPDEEAIREKAEEIFYQRMERGEHGTALNDWLEAETFLRDSGE